MDEIDVARDVNRRICEIASRYEDDARVDYVCECGCMGIVNGRLSEYVRNGGTWLPGHRADVLAHRARTNPDQ